MDARTVSDADTRIVADAEYLVANLLSEGFRVDDAEAVRIWRSHSAERGCVWARLENYGSAEFRSVAERHGAARPAA